MVVGVWESLRTLVKEIVCVVIMFVHMGLWVLRECERVCIQYVRGIVCIVCERVGLIECVHCVCIVCEKVGLIECVRCVCIVCEKVGPIECVHRVCLVCERVGAWVGVCILCVRVRKRVSRNGVCAYKRSCVRGEVWEIQWVIIASCVRLSEKGSKRKYVKYSCFRFRVCLWLCERKRVVQRVCERVGVCARVDAYERASVCVNA